MKRLIVLIAVLTALTGGYLLSSNWHFVNQASTTPNKTAAAEPIATNATLLAAVNAERSKYGAPALIEEPKLDQSAQAKACDEYGANYHGHIDSAGHHGYELAEQSLGLPGHYGENLVWGNNMTTNNAVSWWINSKIHHEAMINPDYTLTGFGICGNGADIVEHFYTPN